MNKKVLILSMALTMGIISCSKDDNTTDDSISENIFKVNSNSADLKTAIKKSEAGVIDISLISSNGKKQSSESESKVANIAMEEIATIEPPVLNGNAMRATHVDIDGNYVYVAYTKEGSTYLGGADIIDISDEFNPVVVSRVTTDQADINALYYKDGNVFFIGALNERSSSPDRTIIGKVSTSQGEFSSDFITRTQVIGQAGVDIFPVEDQVVAISGSDGIIASYSPIDLSYGRGQRSYSDLRSGAYSNGKLVVLSGDQGLLQLNPDSFKLEKTISIPNLVPESKRTISFLGDLVMVSQGPNGVGIYDLNSGSEVVTLPINMLPETTAIPSEKVTNAVSVSNGLILMANGAAGFGITKLDATHTIIEEGVADIHGSSNYVKAKGDFIFVASGKGGLKIIKMSKVNPSTNEGDNADNNNNDSGVFANCGEYPTYNGGEYLNVNKHDELEYRGSATLKGINVNEKLTFCGSLNVTQTVNINSHGEFNMNGSLAVNKDLNINAHSVLRIYGSLTVYGDLNLNSGSTIEFVGEGSSVHIYGKVNRNQNTNVTGDYTDDSGKL